MENFERARALFYEGLACFGREQYEMAEEKFQQCLDLVPDRLSTLTNLCATQIKLGKLEAARKLCARTLALDSASSEAWLNLGMIEQESKRPLEAIECFDKAIQVNPGFAEAWSNKGAACSELRRHVEALNCHDRAIELRPDYAEAYCNRGIALKDLGRFENALSSFDTAIQLKPKYAVAHNNRGLTLQELDRLDEALASYDLALKLRPDYVEVYCNRASALHELGRADEALESYSAALRIAPDSMSANNGFFAVQLSELADVALIGRLARESQSRHLERDRATLISRKAMSDFRVLHDLEQTSHLLDLGYEIEGLREANASLRDIYARCQEGQGHSTTTRLVSLSEAEVAALDRFARNPIAYEVPDIAFCLNPENDWSAIEEAYLACNPEMVVIDNLLSGQALQELRNFCHRSNVWMREYRRQYLGAFATNGFVSPLHVRIGMELRQRLPRIFGGQGLNQLWGFKYTSKLGSGINVHADFAKVNLNFWITPDEANLDPDSGGLIVYDVPSPPSWRYRKYNEDEQGIYDFLKQNGAVPKKVSHKCNRAVLFNSTLFHETDRIHFREGYLNRRINITYLFGKGLKGFGQ